jgi:choline dehydrogenase
MTNSRSPRADYIIVGAGSAGCVLANRLSADPANSVLLLEAGGGDKHPLVAMPLGFLKMLRNPKFIWNYKSEPEPTLNGREVLLPRGRLLGGSSSINGMLYMRGHPLDYDEWASLGCSGWSFAEVLPYFKRSESNWRGAGDYHGADGPLAVSPIDTTRLLHTPLMNTAEVAGHAVSADIDGEDTAGFARGDVTIDRRGRRASASRAYLWPAMRRPNLRVETGAVSQRVLIENGRAIGIEYRQDGELKRVLANKEVLLASGAYNSPQLLMLSGIGPAEELERLGIEVKLDLPGVGRNLSEHPRINIDFEAKVPTFVDELRLDRAIASVAQWATSGKGSFASQINSANIVMRTEPHLARPDVQLLCNPVHLTNDLWFPLWRKRMPYMFSVSVCQLHPSSRGWMTLRSTDPLERPRIHLNIFSNPEELATVRRGIREVRRIYRLGEQGRLTGQERAPSAGAETDAELDAYIRAYAGVTQHPVGTCAMGVGPDAVVDPQLRVRGIAALRVIDASIMPTIPGANTNAAAIMIGEKGADLVLGRRLPPIHLARRGTSPSGEQGQTAPASQNFREVAP